MAYGISHPDSYRRAATYVDKIFKGARPGDLPIEQPTKFEFVVNMKAAKALGLTIPHALLVRADEIVREPVSRSATASPGRFRASGGLGGPSRPPM
ncbi:MAG TPA: ABC transporter substrate binding protein [Methylomirabilota bacterium]|nr:ABC transporter substrate binding protein [Methylomirabilota bacterium]